MKNPQAVKDNLKRCNYMLSEIIKEMVDDRRTLHAGTLLNAVQMITTVLTSYDTEYKQGH